MNPRENTAKSEAAPPRPQGRIDPQLQEHIGHQLRSLYNEVVEEPIPDRFLKLLEELERKSGDKE